MPAKVTLKVTGGELMGTEFPFEERTTCIIGRAEDSSPRVPNDKAHKTISRHHCLLDINPPDIRVRDFGSLNGTFVNGRKIGQREKGQTAEEAAKIHFPEHDLKDGDKIKLGKTVFRVSIYVPAYCTQCRVEIPDEKRGRAQRAPGVYQCEACRQKAAKAGIKEPPKKKPKVCAKCGRDVAAEIGEHREGDYVCVSCKADPLEILQQLLGLARSKHPDVAAIEGYEIIKELGRGGMGAVYLARHERTRQQVALKVMLPQVAAEERAKRQFLRETENSKALKHPNVVQLINNGCSNGTYFFTMEFCEGGSVDKLMEKRGGTLPVDEACQIILQALDGLEYAHNAVIPHVELADGSVARARGVVHRDLSPHNLFLSGSAGSWIGKLGDYGLAKAFDKAGLSGQTRTGTAAGKPWFMPRQQVINYKYSKPEVDVWAMAACLYNMLTGLVPRDFPHKKDPWQIVLQSEPIPIRRRKSSIPKRLADVIDQALVDRPQIPFKTAADLKRALASTL